MSVRLVSCFASNRAWGVPLRKTQSEGKRVPVHVLGSGIKPGSTHQKGCRSKGRKVRVGVGDETDTELVWVPGAVQLSHE